MHQNGPKQKFHIILIKPSKYDDDGYVINWLRGVITSNSLACLHGLTVDAFQCQNILPDVEPVIHVLDETVQLVKGNKLARRTIQRGEKAIVCLVGVQTNQYARALDLGLEFKAKGFPVLLGGFHVSGILEMLPHKTPEIQEALDAGITLIAGEVEKRWAELLKTAYEDKLEPLYDFINDKPELVGVPGPMLPVETIGRFFNLQTSFDAGRGCPFKCSFCTIINIQGNTMRGRSADDIERLIRYNHGNGHTHLFITDDNFARHQNWEEIADRIIKLKREENIRCSIMIQTDTVAHKIPRFIEKMTEAGVRRVFIGLETVNPDNLRATGKYQNQLKEYRRMLQAWRDHGAITYAGYIVGFPDDTYESIMRDVEFLKHEIPLDFAEFFIMTPLPGSKDHQKYYLEKKPMAGDTNEYDTMHVTIKHPKMSGDELLRAYNDAWKSFYGPEHCRTLLLRRKGPRRRLLFSSLIWFRSCVFLANAHPLLGGFFRLKGRHNRRRYFPVESVFTYYPKRVWELVSYTFGLLRIVLTTWRMKKQADRPENAGYMDVAITPEPAIEKPAGGKAPEKKAYAV